MIIIIKKGIDVSYGDSPSIPYSYDIVTEDENWKVDKHYQIPDIHQNTSDKTIDKMLYNDILNNIENDKSFSKLQKFYILEHLKGARVTDLANQLGVTRQAASAQLKRAMAKLKRKSYIKEYFKEKYN